MPAQGEIGISYRRIPVDRKEDAQLNAFRDTRVLTEAALAVALAFVLGFVVLFKMPNGGGYRGLVARAARFVVGAEEPAMWTISTGGRVVGSLIRDGDGWRLSWFAEADRRLVDYAGPVTGDLEALAVALGRRLGAPVELQSLPT